MVKILWWDGQGACLFSKRLERGRFVWPAAKDGKVKLTAAQLSMLLEGLDWRAPRRIWRPLAVAEKHLYTTDCVSKKGGLVCYHTAMVALPKDVATLQAVVRSAQAQIAAHEAQLATREADVRNRDFIIEKLRHQLAGLRQHYEVSCESLDQLELALEDEEVARAAAPGVARAASP